MVKKHTEYLIGLVGGIITLVVGILSIIFGAIWFSQFQNLGIYLGIWGTGCGILILVGAAMFKRDNKTLVGPLLMLIFGILGVITLQGWIIGPVLAIIAAILAIANK